MQVSIPDREEPKKDKKTILREEKVKKEKKERKNIKEVRKVKKELLREVTVKIGLERVDMQEGIMMETLLDSRVTELVMSFEFAKKQGFKLKKLEKPIYVRNMNGMFNKGPI